MVTEAGYSNLPHHVNKVYRFKVETRGGFLLGFYHSKWAAKCVRDRYNAPAEWLHLRQTWSLAVVRRGLDHARGETGTTRWGREVVDFDRQLSQRFVRVAT